MAHDDPAGRAQISCVVPFIVNPTEGCNPASSSARRARSLSRTVLLGHGRPVTQAQVRSDDTVLTGALPDHTALYGVLAQMEALGLDCPSSGASRHAEATGADYEPCEADSRCRA